MAFGVEKEILRLNVAVSDTLTVKVHDAIENLLEATFDLAWTHATI